MRFAKWMALVAVLGCGSAQASLTRYYIAGMSTSGFGVGMPYTGYIEVDSSALIPSWGGGGYYTYGGQHSIDINGKHSSGSLFYGYAVTVQDTGYDGGTVEELRVRDYTPSGGGTAGTTPYIDVILHGDPDMIWSSWAPLENEPLVGPLYSTFDPAHFTNGTISFSFAGVPPTYDQDHFTGTVTAVSLTPVPEPGTVAMLAVVGAGWLCRRGRRSF